MSGTEASYSKHLRPLPLNPLQGTRLLLLHSHLHLAHNVTMSPEVSQGQRPVIVTHSERESRPSSLYEDFVTDQLCDQLTFDF